MVKIFFERKLDRTHALKLGTCSDAGAENLTGGGETRHAVSIRFPE